MDQRADEQTGQQTSTDAAVDAGTDPARLALSQQAAAHVRQAATVDPTRFLAPVPSVPGWEADWTDESAWTRSSIQAQTSRTTPDRFLATVTVYRDGRITWRLQHLDHAVPSRAGSAQDTEQAIRACGNAYAQAAERLF